MSDVLPPTTRWLDEHLAEWIEAGIVDEAQRSAIESYERGRETAVARRLGIGAEVAVYLGSVLALTGGAVAVGNAWDELSFPARLALACAIAVVGLAGGHWTFRYEEPGTDRVAGFITALGVGGVAFGVALVGDRIDPRERAWVVVAVGVAVLAVSALVWANRDRPMQLAGTVLGFGIAGSALLEVVGEHVWVGGLVAIAVGTGLALFGHVGRVRPELMAVVAGGVVAYIGGFMLGDLNEHLGPAAALGIAVVFVLSAVRVDQPLLLVLAIFGATIASAALLSTTFDSALSALFIALIGLVLVVVVVMRSSRRSSEPVPD